MELFSNLSLNYNPDNHKMKYEENEVVNQESFSEDVNMPLKTFELISKEDLDESELYKNKIQDLSTDQALDKKLSFEVIDQCLFLIDKLNPLSLRKIYYEDIYSTECGTVIFDWEKNSDNVFSLEIGSKAIGYFIEVEGKDIKQVDSVILNKHIDILIKDLNNFLNDSE